MGEEERIAREAEAAQQRQRERQRVEAAEQLGRIRIREERERIAVSRTVSARISIRQERERIERLIASRNDNRYAMAEDEQSDDGYGYGDENAVNVSAMSYNELLERFPMDSRGAKEETIERLPTERFRAVKGRAADSKDNQCCFCLEQFQEGEAVRRLQCLHIFHVDEIDQWLRQNRECPI